MASKNPVAQCVLCDGRRQRRRRRHGRYWTPAEKAHASRMLACSFVGSPATVRAGLTRFVAETSADELIVAA